MSEQTPDQRDAAETQRGSDVTDPGGYGSLSVEDDSAGTVDPADLAGAAGPDDADVGYQPEWSEADETDA